MPFIPEDLLGDVIYLVEGLYMESLHLDEVEELDEHMKGNSLHDDMLLRLRRVRDGEPDKSPQEVESDS